jgi:hypothetical protein
MNFTFNVSDPSATTINQTICSPNTYSFNGQSYSTSGTYTATLTNAAGCDSVITLNLTVNQPSASTINQTICSPNTYSFDGQSISVTGIYRDTLTNAAGCDSVITLNLTVNQPSATTINQTICSPSTYSFDGQSISVTGIYRDTLTNAAGCDSVITLNLTVNQPSATTINQTICSPSTYSFDGQSISVTGIYRDTLTNAAGCDSVITLNLTVNLPSATTLNETICSPNSYSFNGQSYSTSGTYTATLTNAAGCDSIVTLNLTIQSCDFDLGVRVYIQGYYRASDSSMVPLLYNLARTSDSNATDTILVSLWNPSNLTSPVLSISSVLNKFGFAYINVPDSIRNNPYYVSINHRNSFEVWSSASVLWSDSLVYDFTSSASSAYSNGSHSPMKQLSSGRFGLYSGDVNQDGIIDAEDLDIVWLATFGSPGSDYWISDLNADEIPDAEDLDILWLNSFGSLAVSRP